MASLICDDIARLDVGKRSHVAGAFSTSVLKRIEALLPKAITASAETGCGKSTILFSALSDSHTVFCIDDRNEVESSVKYFQECSLTRHEKIELVLGPTQKTLPTYRHYRKYDVVLIDGPHGYPFPELEYLFLYPNIKEGGLLIVDDVHIATIGRLADFIAEDEMFRFEELVSTTAVFRRTEAPVFDPNGDGWWTQHYNRRRIAPGHKALAQFALADGKKRRPFALQFGQDVSRLMEQKRGQSALAKLARGIWGP
jgi:hypothetical protein